LAGIKVCLDPGHGGDDPGAVNAAYGLEEKEINLDVAQGIQALLESEGAAVVLTRDDNDTYLTNSARYTFCNQEQATILVSVHTNSVVDPTWDGTLTLYGPMVDPDLAAAIHEEMYPYLLVRTLDGVYFRDYVVSRFASGVLFKCDMPAAMIEPLFMSNPVEAALLVTPIAGGGTDPSWDSRRAEIAYSAVQGIKSYFGVAEPTPTPPPGNMHVRKIEMRLEDKGVRINALAEVFVVNAVGVPVAGAVVSGQWSGATNDADEVITDENGLATITSDRTRETSGTLRFTVERISKEDWTYHPAANGEKSDEIEF
jgi:N-acetylmuramoyl-L-alanine amidase